MTLTAFTGASIFDGTRFHADAALLVEEGEIVAVGRCAAASETVTLPGGFLAPGFIDLQVNGGDGLMLNDAPNLEGLARICAVHERLGTTGLLPTLISDAPDITRTVIEAGIAAAHKGTQGFLGLHLEGPHLDPRRIGAHAPARIRPMAAEDLDLLCNAAALLPALLVTLAPEAVTLEQIRTLDRAGAIVSLGHSDTSFATAQSCFAAGARSVTHLFNAMSPLTHREPGLVGAALDSGVYCGLIADGVHVLPSVMRIALAARRTRDNIYLVTDAMAPAGTDLAEFVLCGHKVLRRGRRLVRADGTLAGADLDMMQAIRLLVQEVGVNLGDALRMATAIPGELIGCRDMRGRLAPGSPADFVHISDDLCLMSVWRGGNRVAWAP
jgi:N-acetylglucosamine-6-phosphate deacetylase